MLFYSDLSHPRLNYMLDLISNEIFNEPFILISDRNAFIAYAGPKLNYSAERISEKEFFIRPQGILFETGIHEQEIRVFIFNNRPAFFQTGGDYAFDIFSAVFLPGQPV